MPVSISKQNHELLTEIAKGQLTMASDISNLTNKVADLDGSTGRLISYLKDDPKTGKKGL